MSGLRFLFCALLSGAIIPVAFCQFTGVSSQFDGLRSSINPAATDQDYLIYDGFYHRKVEGSFYSGLSAWSGSAVRQAALQLQFYPASIRFRTFQWFSKFDLFRDQFGATAFQYLQGSAGVQLITGQGNYLAGAFTLGYQQMSIDLGGQQLVQIGDPLQDARYAVGSPQVGMGIFYDHRYQDRHDFFVGVSLPGIFVFDQIISREQQEVSLVLSPAILVGMNYFLSDYAYLEPVLVVHQQQSWTANIRFHFRRAFWVGGGVAANRASAEAGFRFRNLIRDGSLQRSHKNYWRLSMGYRFGTGRFYTVESANVQFRIAYLIN
ncbi:MAG: type IX secretion system membrane protein PorP/SprF [Lewinellaceae bacterium]|nr:type IX secretion system membrane protein PorP/SprF [Lewinellaceae bacterium]